ncbi:MAG TPA: zinc ribbon domain-containing protein [Burkholderiales bacterium]|nr:zinc ribbon domain-containing protein [Burkholderiales bacterium]
MPIYEYQCAKCGFKDEYLQKVSERPLTRCPSCGKQSFRKLISAAGFQLKGSGWYATDFKGGAKKAEGAKPEAKADPGSEAKAEKKAEKAAGESKPGSKADKTPATSGTN